MRSGARLWRHAASLTVSGRGRVPRIRSSSLAVTAAMLLSLAGVAGCDSSRSVPSMAAVGAPALGATVGSGSIGGSGIPASAVLDGVAASSPRNAWVVGYQGPGINSKTLTLRWNGTRWSQVPSPSPRPGSGLYGVAATSARDGWAAGENLIIRWNGATWK